MAAIEEARLVAVASRTLDRAQQFAETFGVRSADGSPGAYGDYAALLADREVEVVYIPLPNHLHVEWSIKALEAGKHVLVEKPLARNLDEADAIVAAGDRCAVLLENRLGGFVPAQRDILKRIEATAPEGADLTSWRY